jgi:HlyD family secretion protein
VTYEVNLRYNVDDELPVLLGLTGNANLITAQREDVLLVTNQAIRPDRAAGKFYVDVQTADGSFQETEVTIGLRDDQNTQITGGLTEGDVVRLISSQPTINFGPPDAE